MNRSKRHPAFAATTAIVLMGFVTVALAIMTTSLGAENYRTRRTIALQQIQQLLLIGASQAQSHLDAASTPAEVAIPKALFDQNAHLTINPPKITGDKATIEINAQVGAISNLKRSYSSVLRQTGQSTRLN